MVGTLQLAGLRLRCLVSCPAFYSQFFRNYYIMANVWNVISKFNFNSCASYTQKILKNSIPLQIHCRTLYHPRALGIDGYLQQRERTAVQLANIADKFKTKMKDYTGDESKNMIFTEDLKNMIHLADNEDVELVIRMMNKFNEQNKQLRFGNFVFGPVVMRMFHHLNKPEEALKCFNSEKLQGFFDQLVSYQLLMDLLYENQKYHEIIDCYKIIRDRQMEGIKYPRNIVVLTLAACYKLNTPEALELALDLWTQLNETGHQPMRRAVTFLAGLAIQQNKPEVALEIISTARNQNYTTIRNLRVAALIDIKRIDEIIAVLKSVLSQDTEINRDIKHTFNKDVVDKVRTLVEKSDSTELQQEFKRTLEYLQEHQHITDTTLDEQLCSEIQPPPHLQNNQGFQQSRFNRFQRRGDNFRDDTRNKFIPRQGRPGLSDIQ